MRVFVLASLLGQTEGANRLVRTVTNTFLAGQAADAAAATKPTDPILADKVMQHQTELSTLLSDDQAMINRFEEFMADKYPEEKKKLCSSMFCQPFIKGDKPLHKMTVAEAKAKNPKFRNFVENVELALERNIKAKGRVAHGITSLMDLDEQGFRKLLGYPSQRVEHEKLPRGMTKEDHAHQVLEGPGSWEQTSEKKATADDAKDWQAEGCTTPIKNQGQCGSCWAFSTVQSIESAALVQGEASKDDPFIGSPQELVSCDRGGIDNGCNGGLPEEAFKYLQDTPLETEDDDPYVSGDGHRPACGEIKKHTGEFVVDKATQVAIWGLGEDQDMTDWMLGDGPLSVAVHANRAWQTYKGGQLTYQDCDDSEGPNHAVQAVAVKTKGDEDGDAMWVVRNSWGADWGEEGNIRLDYNQNVCNIAFEAFGVKVKPYDAKEEDCQVKEGPALESK